MFSVDVSDFLPLFFAAGVLGSRRAVPKASRKLAVAMYVFYLCFGLKSMSFQFPGQSLT